MLAQWYKLKTEKRGVMRPPGVMEGVWVREGVVMLAGKSSRERDEIL